MTPFFRHFSQKNSANEPYSCDMRKTNVTKYRLILSLSDQDVAFEPLYSELKEIEHKYSDSEAVNNEKRKLFLRILLTYCITHSCNTPMKNASVHLGVATVDQPTRLAPSPPPTPPPDKPHTSEKEITTPSGLKIGDSRIHFGDLKLDIE
jgi:hypothetical protein